MATNRINRPTGKRTVMTPTISDADKLERNLRLLKLGHYVDWDDEPHQTLAVLKSRARTLKQGEE